MKQIPVFKDSADFSQAVAKKLNYPLPCYETMQYVAKLLCVYEADQLLQSNFAADIAYEMYYQPLPWKDNPVKAIDEWIERYYEDLMFLDDHQIENGMISEDVAHFHGLVDLVEAVAAFHTPGVDPF